MEIEKESLSPTLGRYLEKGRQHAGLSLRRLATASGVPLRTIRRILNDEVESPAAEDLQQLARVLELDESDVFGYIGVTPPKGLPDVAPYLRAKHKLKGESLNKAAEEIQSIINKYDNMSPE
ncbi:helix-turn-helix domain-containing protein [Streptomyces koyangensis]|uniref:helix-turn-helix domain-containing protein n=1 Tax=Streptomyces koyangensis TaxID=188770 RepID=UPI003C30E5D6